MQTHPPTRNACSSHGKWLVAILGVAAVAMSMRGPDAAFARSSGLCINWNYQSGDFILFAPKGKLPRPGICRVMGANLSRTGPVNFSSGTVVGSLCLDKSGLNGRGTFQGTGYGAYDGLYHQVGLVLALGSDLSTGSLNDSSGEVAPNTGPGIAVTLGPCPF